jgi:hypothetical protein
MNGLGGEEIQFTYASQIVPRAYRLFKKRDWHHSLIGRYCWSSNFLSWLWPSDVGMKQQEYYRALQIPCAGFSVSDLVIPSNDMPPAICMVFPVRVGTVRHHVLTHFVVQILMEELLSASRQQIHSGTRSEGKPLICKCTERNPQEQTWYWESVIFLGS